MHNSTGPSAPTANIAVNRNRLKHYDGGQVYLADKTQFEIELYNPKQVKVMAMIYLNGQPISSSGLVLNPGQRYFLDRWLDRPDKFRFDVYEHDGSPSSQAAIAKNGDVRVEFFDEKIPARVQQVFTPTWFYTPGIAYWGSATCQSDVTFSAGSTSTGSAGSLDSSAITVSSCLYSAQIDQPLSRSVSEPATNPHHRRKSVVKGSNNTETGRVGHGEASSQAFVRDTTEFNPWYATAVSLKIMPMSHKPVEQVRNYCTKCGTRKKSDGWKFCPVCGTEI